MITRILIANRGEIACRVIATARRLGIETVAVYSEADAGALHVALADEALHIGAANASESYLNAPRIIAAARESGAQAIHPGYGFLAENADFAEACGDAGLLFIGPPAAAMRTMGCKRTAKQRLSEVGMPLVPGYHDNEQDDRRLAVAADDLGYPLLIKAVAGGGGRGMRLVADAEAFPQSLASARREAVSAFGDGDVLLEKYLPSARHVEIQVFRDRHGNGVHLFERDCSLQRRRQKVIEEAPAVGVSPALRRSMGACALEVAAAVEYQGAGTVEFLLDAGGDFYFMEMNTRLQVEHPVTEMITGQDLVEWQLRVAAGEALPRDQQALVIDGHAVEARIYAEDPARDFAPSSGCLLHLRLPQRSPWLRIDRGVKRGEQVDVYYDPLLAKLIAHGADRGQALRRLRHGLAAVEIAGVHTNVDFLRSVLAHPDIAGGAVDNGFIDRHADEFRVSPAHPPDAVLAHACLYLLGVARRRASEAAAASSDPYSPWHRVAGWRLNEAVRHPFVFRCGGGIHRVTAHQRGPGLELELPGGRMHCRLVDTGERRPLIELNGRRSRARVIEHGGELEVFVGGRSYTLRHHDPLSATEEVEEADDRVIAPLPGRIASVHVDAGDCVSRGQALLTIEAMKMEHVLNAACDAVVAEVRCRMGDLVEENAELILLQT